MTTNSKLDWLAAAIAQLSDSPQRREIVQRLQACYSKKVQRTGAKKNVRKKAKH